MENKPLDIIKQVQEHKNKSKIIDGRAFAKQKEAELKAKIDALKILYGANSIPKLTIILDPNNSQSLVYAKLKAKSGNRIGLPVDFIITDPDFDTKKITNKLDFNLPIQSIPGTTASVLKAIKNLNKDNTVAGIIVQSPLQKNIDQEACFQAVITAKDVDALNDESLGKMSRGEGYQCATPDAVRQLLQINNVTIKGKIVAIFGNSRLFGKPMNIILNRLGATTITFNSKSTDEIKQVLTPTADIAIFGVGKENVVDEKYIKDGATVILVGATHNSQGELVGDIPLSDTLRNRLSKFSEVSGGVGPATVACLMEQTTDACEKLLAQSPSKISEQKREK